MASCPHCHAALVEPAVFCGVCGARLGSGTERVDERVSDGDDPGATTRLEGPAAETQPMKAAVVENSNAPEEKVDATVRDAAPPGVETGPPATASDRPGDSLMRVVRPRWLGPARVGLAVLVLAAAGWLGARALHRGGAPPTSPQRRETITTAEPAPSDPPPDDPTAIRPTPRRVGRATGRAPSVGTGMPNAASDDPYADLDHVQQVKAGTAPVAPAVPGAPAAPPTPVGAPAAAAPAAPVAAAPAAPVAAPAAARPDAAASAAASKADLDSAAQYMKGEDYEPPSAEDLAERDRAEGFAGSIRMVARAHAAQVSACYERAFKIDAPAHAARVEVGFTVDKNGMPGKVRVVSNNSGSDALGNCLVQRVGAWRFPRPPGGDFEAVYPFTFSGAR